MHGVLHIVMDREIGPHAYTDNVLVLTLDCLDCVPFFHFCCTCLHLFPFLFSRRLLHLTGPLVYSFSPFKSIIHTVTSFLLLKPRPIHATLCCFNAPVGACSLQDNLQFLHSIQAVSNLLTTCFSHHTLGLGHTGLFTVPEYIFINLCL